MGETYPGLDGCKPPGAGKHPTAADDGMFLERHRGPGDGESFVVIEILLNLDDLARFNSASVAKGSVGGASLG